MTQRSYFWDGIAVGDALLYAPYDAPTELALVLISVAAAGAIPTYFSGVCRDELNELEVTGAVSPISVATGRALCFGSWLESDDIEPFVITTPGGSTRIDRIVVKKDWVTQETRLEVVTGVPGAGVPPALVNVLGDVWYMPLYQISITTGGAITLTDERDYTPRYDHQHLGTRKDSAQLVLGSIPDGMFTANAAGRAKFAPGFFALSGQVVANANVTAPGGPQVIPGATFNAPMAGVYLIWAVIHFRRNGISGIIDNTARLCRGSGPLTPLVHFAAGAANDPIHATVAQNWRLVGVTLAETIWLEVSLGAAHEVIAADTTLTYMYTGEVA